MLIAFSASAQIAISENFDSGASDWETGGFFFSATQACEGQSVRENLYSGNTSGDLTSPNIVGQSNATDLSLSFDYKIVDWSAATDATPPGWGNFVIQYSTDDGANWIDIDTIDDSNHTTSSDCATLNYTIAAADLPMGSDFKLQFVATQTGGDYYLYFDNISALQAALMPPSCDSVLTTPVDGETAADIDGNISWSVASGIPTGYFLTVGTTSGGNDVVDNLDVGNVTTYALGQLNYATTYYVTITAYNANGTTTDTCTEQSFTTQDDPNVIVDCAVGPANTLYCYSTNNIDPADESFSYTSSDGSQLILTFNAGQVESCCDELIVLDSDGVTQLFNGTNGGDLTGLTFQSTGDNISWYIQSDGSINCGSSGFTQIDASVACATCNNPNATFAVRQDCLNGPQFFIDIDLTDLGSASSITISDDQGSTPINTSATGLFSFGPFANGTVVTTTVANDDDANCTIVSDALTQDQCVLNQVDCAAGPLNLTHCYGNNDDTTWLFMSTDGSPVRLTFNAGGIESCCDDILVYDGADNTAPLIYQGNNGGDLSGLQFDSTGDSLFLEIDADGSVSCASGSFCCGVEWDFTAVCATCVNPTSTFDVRSDCVNGPQFFVDVDVTDLGSAGSVTVSDDQGSAPQVLNAPGLVSFGPFANGTPVNVAVVNDDDANCEISSAELTQPFCLDNIVDCTAGPVSATYCYGNNDTNVFQYTSTDGSPLNLTIDVGGVENNFDELVIFDSDGVTNLNPTTPYGNAGDITGLTFQSTGDTIFFAVQSDGSVSCESGSGCCAAGIEYTVACATCENPEATYAVVSDCVNGPQFFIDVDLTSIGSATSITISDDQGSADQTTSAIGVFTFGPYPNTTDVVITVTNDDDANCTISSNSLTQEFCLDNVVDCTVGPLNASYCYENNESNIFQYTSSDGSPLNLLINSGAVEGLPWDTLVILDSDGVTELYNDEGNDGDISGLSFQSTGDTIFFTVQSDGSVSCASGSAALVGGIDYTVSCATCINPAATYAVIDDCDNGDQFLIDVDVTSLGDANSLTISNNIDANTVAVNATGVYQVGPFPFLTDVVITISSDDDVNCVINSPAIQVLACPPDNDNCDGAINAVVNDGATCDLVTPGTVLAATPSGVPGAACGGDPDDDVWFEFTALSEVQLISLINIQGGFNLDHAVYEGTCGSLTELYCSNDDASVTPQLVVGNTYYVRVFSGGSDNETITFDLCIREAPTNIICENAVNFCSENGALVTSNIVGIPDPSDIACLFSAPNPTWNIIQIGDSGTIEIEIVQTDDNGNGLDVDFVLWGPFTSVDDACGNLDLGCPNPGGDCPNNTSNPDFYPFGNIVDCSYSIFSTENLTIDNAIEGEIYILLVTNFSDQPGNISIGQTNSSDTGSGTVTAEIEAEITSNEVVFSDVDNDPSTPDEASVCGFTSVTIEADSPFADTYIWYQNGFVITGETGPTLTVTESDIYQVQAFDDNCNDDAFSQIVRVNLYDDPGTVAPQNLTVCDGPTADGVEDFDLDALTTSLGFGSDFTVSYYTSTADANQAINAVTSPYTSAGETLIIRVEDTDAANDGFLGCRQLSEVELVVNALPPVNQPNDLIVCDDLDGTVDGSTSFDLQSLNDEISTDPDVVITYHASQADADAGTGDLPNPYTSSGETIYARVENTLSGCHNVVSFNIVVNIVPLATFDDQFDYEVCPNATVPVDIGIVPSNFTLADVTIAWYLDGVLIPGETGLVLSSVLVEGDYTAEITFNDSGCVNSISVFVVELESCVIPQGISPNNDGVNDVFDLSSYDVVRLEIFNRNGTLVYSKSNYTNEWVGQTNDGEELPVGTYFYTMVYEGGAKSRSAWIYINR